MIILVSSWTKTNARVLNNPTPGISPNSQPCLFWCNFHLLWIKVERAADIMMWCCMFKPGHCCCMFVLLFYQHSNVVVFFSEARRGEDWIDREAIFRKSSQNSIWMSSKHFCGWVGLVQNTQFSMLGRSVKQVMTVGFWGGLVLAAPCRNH